MGYQCKIHQQFEIQGKTIKVNRLQIQKRVKNLDSIHPQEAERRSQLKNQKNISDNEINCLMNCSHICRDQIISSHLQWMHNLIFKKPMGTNSNVNYCCQKNFQNIGKVMLSLLCITLCIVHGLPLLPTTSAIMVQLVLQILNIESLSLINLLYYIIILTSIQRTLIYVNLSVFPVDIQVAISTWWLSW